MKSGLRLHFEERIKQLAKFVINDKMNYILLNLHEVKYASKQHPHFAIKTDEIEA